MITGTSKANAIADFYNSTGVDDPTPERFAALDEKKIVKENDARKAFLNPFGTGCSMSSVSTRRGRATFGASR